MIKKVVAKFCGLSSISEVLNLVDIRKISALSEKTKKSRLRRFGDGWYEIKLLR